MLNFRPARLRCGVGNGNPSDGLCLMQMVDWFSGSEKVSDHPACASPVLRMVGICLNDMATDEQRDLLWPLVWQLLNSRDPAKEQARAEYLVREVAHRIVAKAFDLINMPDHASNLRRAKTMPELEAAARVARAAAAARGTDDEGVTAAARMAAAALRVAKAAAKEAAAEEWAAAAAEEWAVWSASAAAAAASAAGAAARTAAEWGELRIIFSEAIALGRHGNADPVYMPRAIELQRRLETAK